MKRQKGLPRQSGLTLVELLLGITIAVMIFIGASSMMAFLFRIDTRTKANEEIEQTKNDLGIEFTNSIRWATQISFTKSMLTADANTYLLSDGRILKNSDPITPTNLEITSFDIKDYSQDPDTKSLEILVGLENKNAQTFKDILRFVVSQRKTEFSEE